MDRFVFGAQWTITEWLERLGLEGERTVGIGRDGTQLIGSTRESAMRQYCGYGSEGLKLVSTLAIEPDIEWDSLIKGLSLTEKPNHASRLRKAIHRLRWVEPPPKLSVQARELEAALAIDGGERSGRAGRPRSASEATRMGYPVPEPLPEVDTGPLQPYGAALPVSIKVSERMGVRPKTPPSIRMPKDAEEKLRRAIDEDGDNPDINMLLAFELRKLRALRLPEEDIQKVFEKAKVALPEPQPKPEVEKGWLEPPDPVVEKLPLGIPLRYSWRCKQCGAEQVAMGGEEKPVHQWAVAHLISWLEEEDGELRAMHPCAGFRRKKNKEAVSTDALLEELSLVENIDDLVKRAKIAGVSEDAIEQLVAGRNSDGDSAQRFGSEGKAHNANTVDDNDDDGAMVPSGTGSADGDEADENANAATSDGDGDDSIKAELIKLIIAAAIAAMGDADANEIVDTYMAEQQDGVAPAPPMTKGKLETFEQQRLSKEAEENAALALEVEIARRKAAGVEEMDVEGTIRWHSTYHAQHEEAEMKKEQQRKAMASRLGVQWSDSDEEAEKTADLVVPTIDLTVEQGEQTREGTKLGV